MSNLIASAPQQISFHSNGKWQRKQSQQCLFCANIVTPSQRQGHWKRYQIIEANDAYVAIKELKNFAHNVQSLSICQPRQPASWTMAGRMNTPDYIDQLNEVADIRW